MPASRGVVLELLMQDLSSQWRQRSRSQARLLVRPLWVVETLEVLQEEWAIRTRCVIRRHCHCLRARLFQAPCLVTPLSEVSSESSGPTVEKTFARSEILTTQAQFLQPRTVRPASAPSSVGWLDNFGRPQSRIHTTTAMLMALQILVTKLEAWSDLPAGIVW